MIEDPFYLSPQKIIVSRVAILYHPDLIHYDFGLGHPFRGDRFPRFMNLLRAKGILNRDDVELHEPEAAGDEDLQLIHSSAYIRMVEVMAERRIPLSADTPLNPGIVRAGRLIVGSALKAGELVAGGRYRVAEVVGGGLHHAGRDYGGGFCIFNDVAICAQNLMERRGLSRILIFDTDAHAGNGTMDIFYDDPHILFISIHQDPRTIYPGTGFIHQIGEGEGEGYTVNVPLPPGADDHCLEVVLQRIFLPLAGEFKPEIILRNGGSDPHFQDGLASLGFSMAGLRRIGEAVAEAASEAGCGVVDLCCSGYNPQTVAMGWLALLSGVAGLDVELEESIEPPRAGRGIYERTVRVVEELERLLKSYWSL